MPEDVGVRRGLLGRALQHVVWNVRWVATLPWRILRWLGHFLTDLWDTKFALRTIVIRLLWVAAGLVALVFVVILGLIFYPNTQIVPQPRPDKVVYLNQGWDRNDREDYYFTPQGTMLKGLRYDWFVNLERPWGRQKFSDPDHLRSYGFWIDEHKSAKNPDLLPVGFARHFDPELDNYVLDITCAACHTGQLMVKQGKQRVAVRIDGGAAMHAFTAMNIGHFGPTLLGAMASTYINPVKFNRFARRVLGENHDPGAKSQLKSDLWQVMMALARQALTDKSKHLYPVEEGFGRTDAVGRISNAVFAENLDEANYRVADAPVSFPPVWDIWKFDWVQYTGSVRQPMARNLGETMGVGARYSLTDEYGRPLPRDARFHTTTLFFELEKLERIIQKLQPPPWPEEYLGKIDWCKATRGRDLFEKHCQHCHGPFPSDRYMTRWNSPLKVCKQYSEDAQGNIVCVWKDENDKADPPHEEWAMHLLPVEDVGTDPSAARNFYDVRVDLSRSALTKREISSTYGAAMRTNLFRELAYYRDKIAEAQSKGDRAAVANFTAKLEDRQQHGPEQIRKAMDELNFKSVSIGAGLSFYGYLMRDLFYRSSNIPEQRQAEMNGWATLDLPEVVRAYKARPLAGMWATAPFLHNGSIPTLYHMLVPATQRPKKFYTGRHEFDAKYVGYESSNPGQGGFLFDTTIPGNFNIGHEFRAGYIEWKPGDPPSFGVIGPELSEQDRWAIVEYLKVHSDQRDVTKEMGQKTNQACRLPASGGGR